MWGLVQRVSQPKSAKVSKASRGWVGGYYSPKPYDLPGPSTLAAPSNSESLVTPSPSLSPAIDQLNFEVRVCTARPMLVGHPITIRLI